MNQVWRRKCRPAFVLLVGITNRTGIFCRVESILYAVLLKSSKEYGFFFFVFIFFFTHRHTEEIGGAAWLAFECFLMKKEIPAVGWWAAGSSRSARWCVFLLKRRIRRAPAFVIRRCHCDDATWGQIDRPIYIIRIYPLCWKERKRRALQQWKVLSNPLPSSISIKTIVVYIQYPLVLLWLFI